MSKISRIDVLVNNAGYVLNGAFEELSIKEIHDQIDTNMLGVIRVTQQVLPFMRRQGNGIIVNVSSVVGRFGLPGASAYVASKFAIEGLSESLAYEVEPFGIKVILIEPGVVKTRIFDNSVIGHNASKEESSYSAMLGSFKATFNSLLERASTPDQVAATILQAISSPEPHFRYLVGKDAEAWIQMKNTMSDEQFQQYTKKSFISSTAASQRPEIPTSTASSSSIA
jgi:NAD(P)-dependent dehydrogenase (short-subunit alcohol dehydrogenase family)